MCEKKQNSKGEHAIGTETKHVTVTDPVLEKQFLLPAGPIVTHENGIEHHDELDHQLQTP